MTGGRASRDKGLKAERELVNKLRDLGMEARRVPLSGASEGFKGDVQYRLGVRTEFTTVEVKRRKKLPAWLVVPETCAAVCLREDNGKWYVLQELDEMSLP